MATYAVKMKSFDKLVELVEGAKKDAALFSEKGNKTAGTRLRKTMIEVVKAAKEVRIEVQEKKNA